MKFIQDVDIKCTKEDLVKNCNSFINRSFDLQEQTTKQGKTLLALTYENVDDDICRLLMKYDKAINEVHITPFKLSSTNFYENMDYQLYAVLESLSLSNIGTFIGSLEIKNVMIINGKIKQCEYGIVEKGSKPVSKDIEQDGSSIGFTIKRTIKEYLNEEPELKANLQGVTTQVDLLNTVARYVLNKRVSGEMDFEDFLDLFRQTCLLGANDPTVLKFYKIVKV